jgi:pimeloyl-ACP methyl ester carboxylesterase
MTERLTSFDGVEIAFEARGAENGSPPVLLHHGFGVDANVNWIATGVMDALVATGRRVVALDARGHGQSDKPHDPAAYGEGAMARDVSALLDLIGAPSVDLVGYSMGAVVALMVAAGGEPRLRRLVVGGVGSGVVELGGVDTRALPIDTVVAALETDDPAEITHPGAAWFRTVADTIGADRAALKAIARARNAVPFELSSIAVPTLLIAGDEDPLAARPEVLSEAIPGARLELLSGDHVTVFGDPRLARTIIDFVNGD